MKMPTAAAERARLLAEVRLMQPEMQQDAARVDATAEFPHFSFHLIRRIGLLRATLPEYLGGFGFGEGAEGAAQLLQLFMLLGEADLSVARLYEAHVNALQLVCRYGHASLAQHCAYEAAHGELFALWVTDPPAGGLKLRSDSILQGGKAFCSGAGAATRALITAATDEGGTRMLVVPISPEVRILPAAIKLSGMRAAITGSVDFSGLIVQPGALLGEAGDYLREPVFSAGAWRSAAGALGGLNALLKRHRDEILSRGRAADPHQNARFGQAVMAYETARLWMAQAALRGCLEDDTDDAVVAYVNLARLAVEAACLDAMRLTQRSLGLGAFVMGHPAERICRDLATYLRQPAPDETLAKAAQFYFDTGLPGER